MGARLLGLALALLMLVAGGLSAVESFGWIGNDPAPSGGARATLGPILAGLGVALAYVTLRKRR